MSSSTIPIGSALRQTGSQPHGQRDSQHEGALSSETDEALLVRYRDNQDRGAFEELVHRYERELYSYLRRYLQDATLAEDAFQGTFLQVHLKCGQFDGERKFRPWLYTIATNHAIDTQRRNKRHRMVSLDQRHADGQRDDLGALLEMLAGDDSGPAMELEAGERRRWIQNAVASLPDPLRKAVHLIYYQGLKYREAADVLGIPVGTVKSRLHTAILSLTDSWKRANLSRDE